MQTVGKPPLDVICQALRTYLPRPTNATIVSSSLLKTMMELRQLRYFVRVVELGSMGRAALDLGVVTSALSQQISRLEGELSTRLLIRSSSGVVPTDAGLAFLRQAQLALRHADSAVQAAQQARLAGHVSVGMPPTTAALLALPFMDAMRERYPDVRLHMVEALSGHLAAMLNARRLDVAILFHAESARRWTVTTLVDEPLFLFARPELPGLPRTVAVRLEDLDRVPLALPGTGHGLRTLIDAAFARVNRVPNVTAEVDGLSVLMDLVLAGHAATIQPSSAAARLPQGVLLMAPIADSHLIRPNVLVSLSDNELSPAALAARLVLTDVTCQVARDGRWPGATLHET
jgi:LysR family tcuABC transcriptional regulator